MQISAVYYVYECHCVCVVCVWVSQFLLSLFQWRDSPEKYHCWCWKLEQQWDRWVATAAPTVDETPYIAKRNVDSNTDKTHQSQSFHVCSHPGVHGKQRRQHAKHNLRKLILQSGERGNDANEQDCVIIKYKKINWWAKKKTTFRLSLLKGVTCITILFAHSLW